MENLKINGGGYIIRQLRIRPGMDLATLADRIGCGKGQLSKLETGRLGLSLEVIDKIAGPLEKHPRHWC